MYLRASTDTLMKRITRRDRPYERQMERAYIDELNLAYDDFFMKYSHNSPVLTIDSSSIDFVSSPEDLKEVDKKIRQALEMAPFQPTLPLE